MIGSSASSHKVVDLEFSRHLSLDPIGGIPKSHNLTEYTFYEIIPVTRRNAGFFGRVRLD